jgi:hypothetical protein
MSLPAEALHSYLLDHVGFVMDLQQVALDSETPLGFNAHGRVHVTNVTTRALHLLHELDPLRDAVQRDRELVIGGLLHDIGNLIGRKLHGLYGIYLIWRMCGDRVQDEETVACLVRVLEIVAFHEVEFASMQASFERLSTASLATIVADKTDVSYRRISSKSNAIEAIQDPHVIANLLVADSSVWRNHAREGAPGQLGWRVDFRTKFGAGHSDLFSQLLKQSGRVKYPKEWTDLYEEASIEYLFLFQSTFLSTYLPRLYVTMNAAFCLFPSVGEFVFEVDDRERGVSIRRVFMRDRFHEQVYTLGKLFNREGWHNSYLYRALMRQLPHKQGNA